MLLTLIELYFIIVSLTGSWKVPRCAHNVTDNWTTWKQRFNKSYNNTREELVRLSDWIDNREYARRHNCLYLEGKLSYSVALNQYADMNVVYYGEKYLGIGQVRTIIASDVIIEKLIPFVPENLTDRRVPQHFDWKTKGAVTPVADQSTCGACWAFATVAAVESHYQIKYKRQMILSKQLLVDCGRPSGNRGCDGGVPELAYWYMTSNGVMAEEDYPYKTMETNCSFDESKVRFKIDGYTELPTDDEQTMRVAVATIGPLTASIDASSRGFQLYNDGVYKDEKCASDASNHLVLITGYGTEYGDDYWLVKNSWGTTWGNQGYVKLERNTNICGIAVYAHYPVL